MDIILGQKVLDSSKGDLNFIEFDIENTFSRKNNKTLRETIKRNTHQNLSQRVLNKYSDSLEEPLGTFLYYLKLADDAFYLDFLNKNGNNKFCKFRTKQTIIRKGIYFFLVDSEIVYVGKTTDSFSKRINNGYGNISPKNCYRDGQSTNCRVNANINDLNNHLERLSFFIYPMEKNLDIYLLEKKLISDYSPLWNIQK